MTGAAHLPHGRIVGLFEGDRVPVGAIDLGGDYLIPGLVELHTDNLERHLQPRPNVELPCASAILAHDGELASVGITTVFDALRLGSVEGNTVNPGKYARNIADGILELRREGALRIRHLLHLRAELCSETLIEELDEFGRGDYVRLISLMDHTPGQRQFRSLSKLQDALKEKYDFSDRQFSDYVDRGRARRNQVWALHEAAAVNAARRLGAALASHDDTTAEQVDRSRELGIRLGEFPTTFEAAEACRDAGIRIIMGAPNLVRGGSHSGNVSALELAESGLLDIVSSDYAPSLLMNSAFLLAQLWGDLARAVRSVSATPAEATGLADRGRIQEGGVADLVRVRMVAAAPVIRSVWCGGRRVG